MAVNKRELLDDCVHCGFCLPTCPTYVLWGNEMDSPRGRIHLMDLVERGEVPLDQSVSTHIDTCLGCMACVTACPSGVQYDKLLESTRAQVEETVPRTRRERAFRRLIFSLFPYPARLRIASLPALLARRPLQRIKPLRQMLSLMPPVTPGAVLKRTPKSLSAKGIARRRVALLQGCVQRVFFGDVNAATLRVLTAEGCDVLVPKQGCCGALSLHAGRDDEAKAFARKLIEAIDHEFVDAVVVNVAGCGSSLKEYGHLLADDAEYADRAAAFATKVRDITEFLAELRPQAPRHPIAAKVAYHDACHLGHAQGIRTQPRDILNQIPDLELLDVPEPEICCGSAGIYNLVQPDAAADLGKRKAAKLASVRPDAVATANPGCLLQIGRYADLPLFHPVQLVDASITNTPLTDR